MFIATLLIIAKKLPHTTHMDLENLCQVKEAELQMDQGWVQLSDVERVQHGQGLWFKS